MNNKKFELTAADFAALNDFDGDYFNAKGAKLYVQSNYSPAVEYYRLAAVMGNVHSVSNLGYCYLYGREIEQNLSLAIAYFKVAAARRDVDAAYKLGDIYGSDKWGIKDKEMSIYYYLMAADFVMGNGSEFNSGIILNDELQNYPSLCFALGREMSLNGDLKTDLDSAYQFLKQAEEGYRKELANGNNMYEKAYNNVLQFMTDSQFDEIRDEYDDFYDDEYDE